MDSEEVKKYFKDLLECPVCFLTIDSAPVFQCHNGHVVCKDCHPKLETCPICRDANLYDTPMAIRNLKLEEMVLLKIPGAPLSKRSAPGFLSRFHWRFLAQKFIFYGYQKV